jgi:mRNA-degrading endonuclease toxin of MazEF toxin-antitoxin module
MVVRRGEVWWASLPTVGKPFLTRKIGRLAAKQLPQLEEGLRLVLSL